MKIDIAGKTYVVTGASGGIGTELVKLLIEGKKCLMASPIEVNSVKFLFKM